MFEFTTANGKPIPRWASTLLNRRIQLQYHEEYNNLIHQIEDFFEEWTKTHCSKCKSSSWKDDQKKGFAYSHGCCACCGGAKGYYWKIDPMNEVMSHKMHDLLHGFFDESIFGCSLPRHIRSATCLIYCCDHNMAEDISPLVDRVVKLRGFS